MRPLDESARKRKNIRFLFNYHMDRIFREEPLAGRVVGIEAHYTPTILPGQKQPLVSWKTEGNVDFHEKIVTVKAAKGIVIATGGNTGNVEFRRMFDPRLTEEMQVGGGEWSPQDGSGKLAAMAIGAALWGTCNQAMNRNGALRRGAFVGCQYELRRLEAEEPDLGQGQGHGSLRRLLEQRHRRQPGRPPLLQRGERQVSERHVLRLLRQGGRLCARRLAQQLQDHSEVHELHRRRSCRQ